MKLGGAWLGGGAIGRGIAGAGGSLGCCKISPGEASSTRDSFRRSSGKMDRSPISYA
jgi:hypothetical protein